MHSKGTDGKFLHNFGPLNRQKGERRLNVAVTRAKLNVKVVASIRGSDINLDQAKSDGAKLLREYLEYAEKGIDALNVETPQETLYDSTDDFVDEVYDALVEKGYRVDKRVGASGLKIDLAIKIPDADDYFFAVECDGEAYRRSKNAETAIVFVKKSSKDLGGATIDSGRPNGSRIAGDLSNAYCMRWKKR